MGLKEVYLSYDAMEADLIRGLLEDNGISCFIRDMTITPYPMSIGKFAEKRIAVDEGDTKVAAQLIREAIRDGYISSEGKFKK
ncbi:MAG: DUF2007 domain-containing protein [Thermodesulfobacteriota bacterium]